MGLGGYLRPGSNMRLRKGCTVPPIRGVCDFWGLLLNPSEFHEFSKTRTSDDSILWDFQELLWMRRVFPRLRAGPPDAHMWDFDYPTVSRQIARSAELLGVSFVPYQLRHSGPSWEMLRRRRTLAEIQKRGQWRSFSSVQRYEKATKLMAAYHRLAPDLRRHLELVGKNLEAHFCDNKPVPAFAARVGPLRPPRYVAKAC